MHQNQHLCRFLAACKEQNRRRRCSTFDRISPVWQWVMIMVLPEMARKSLGCMLVLGLTCSYLAQAGGAQNALPLPGGAQALKSTAEPVYEAPGTGYSAPLPGGGGMIRAAGAYAAPGAVASSYDKLPLNAGNAIARLEELRNLMPVSRPHEFQETISEFCDWLSDMADAHWKLSQSFAKSDATKAQCESEKQLCFRFGGLKRQAMLLKAEFLISQKRSPEALAPLVDIVTAEPRSTTGQNAYRLLQEIGFSEELPSQGAPIAKTSGSAN